MYLTKLSLKNVKMIRELECSFADGDAPRPFTLFVGENGMCKTTLLRAIALAAVGQTGANQLTSAGSFPDRRSLSECRITATFLPTHGGGASPELAYTGPGEHAPRPVESHLWTGLSWKVFVGSSGYLPPAPSGVPNSVPSLQPIEMIRGRDLPRWFVAGYGTSRALPLSDDVRSDREGSSLRSIARLRSLFGNDALIATGFADVLARLSGDELSRAFARTLRDVLIGDAAQDLPGIFPHGDDVISVTGVELRGRGGVRSSRDLVDMERFELGSGPTSFKVPASWLSQGFQATIAWVADMIGQVFLDVGAPVAPRDIEGLVLIDEIDLHLHPRWQAMLVPALKKTFPRVQFVATTHSPMVLPGLRREEVLVLGLDEAGNVTVREAPVTPALKTGSEIYEHFFGIRELYPSELGSALQDYSFLANNPDRDDAEESRMLMLRKKLRDNDVDPGWEPEPRTAR